MSDIAPDVHMKMVGYQLYMVYNYNNNYNYYTIEFLMRSKSFTSPLLKLLQEIIQSTFCWNIPFHLSMILTLYLIYNTVFYHGFFEGLHTLCALLCAQPINTKIYTTRIILNLKGDSRMTVLGSQTKYMYRYYY